MSAELQVAGDAAGALQRGGETVDDAANGAGDGAPDAGAILVNLYGIVAIRTGFVDF